MIHNCMEIDDGPSWTRACSLMISTWRQGCGTVLRPERVSAAKAFCECFFAAKNANMHFYVFFDETVDGSE